MFLRFILLLTKLHIKQISALKAISIIPSILTFNIIDAEENAQMKGRAKCRQGREAQNLIQTNKT